MQCTMITAVVIVIWVVYGYSFAFGGGTEWHVTHTRMRPRAR